ncbi:hypothetical protein [Ferrithrix thermotolerans]|uniref:hypothetical protein n=1 Tax=Ferrithrix thermotolerans TaxID=209649 RepID=UPI0015BF730B|nr:hypothetical protein [Ferrithrix thermotolerans]
MSAEQSARTIRLADGSGPKFELTGVCYIAVPSRIGYVSSTPYTTSSLAVM